MSVYRESRREETPIPSAPRRGSTPLAFLTMVVAGALLSVQARANGALTDQLSSAPLAGAVSFAVGTAAIAVVAAMSMHRTSRAVRRLAATPRVRGTVVASGAAGAFLIVVSASAATRIGVSLLTICLVAGMTTAALIFDRIGLAPGGRRAVTGPRLVGGALALSAIVVVGAGDTSGHVQFVIIAVVCLAGAAAAFQTAINGGLIDAIGSAVVVTLGVFASGLVLLACVVGGTLVFGSTHQIDWPSDPWPYTGGLYGVLFVIAAAITVARLGVLRSTIATLVGQISAAIIIDSVAPQGSDGVQPTTFVGLALIFVAAVIASRASPPVGTADLADAPDPSTRLEYDAASDA